MPKLKKSKLLRNLKVPWAPQVYSKKRKIAEVEKENVSTQRPLIREQNYH
jgi:hypothetical protein